MAPGMRRVLREPLLHFVLLGAALFALERAFRDDAPGAAGSRTIVANAAVRESVREAWTATHGRPPAPDELDGLVTRWIDDEVLYREGLARGLEKDDQRVRDRVATKMAYVVEAQVVVPEPTEEELEAWFEEHASRWARSELYDFSHVFVEGSGDDSRVRAAELLTKLVAGDDASGLGDTFSGGRRYRRRKLDDLAKSFGDEFVAGMAEQPVGVWGQRRSRHGWHLVRIERRTPAEAPDLSTVREDVKKDWMAAKRARGVTQAMEALRARWEISREP